MTPFFSFPFESLLIGAPSARLSDGPWPAGWSGRDGAAVVGRPSRRRLGQHWSPGNPVPRVPRPTSELQPPEAGLAARAAKEAAQVRPFSKPGRDRRLPATQPHHLRRLAPSSAPLRSDFSILLHVGAEATQLFGHHDQQALTPRPTQPTTASVPRPAEMAPQGQQASETPSRPQRERARAVAVARRKK